MSDRFFSVEIINFVAELDIIKQNYEVTQKDKERTLQDLENLKADNLDLKIRINERDKEKEKLLSEIKHANNINAELSKTIQNQRETFDEQNANIHQLNNLIKKQQATINERTTDNASLKRQIDKLVKATKLLENAKLEAEKNKDIAKNGIYQLEREIDDTNKLAKEDRKIIDTLKNERDLLIKEIHKAEKNNREQAEALMKEQKDHAEKIAEIQNLRKDIERLNKKISQLEKEKDKHGINAAQANAKYFHSLEEIKLKDNLISEFQKKNIETEAKLKQQQNLYEAVRSDRNLYSKNLTETQDETAEIKRRYKIVTHQISQLKEEIDAKGAALAKEHFELAQKEKEIDEAKKKIERLTLDMAAKDNSIKNFVIFD